MTWYDSPPGYVPIDSTVKVSPLPSDPRWREASEARGEDPAILAPGHVAGLPLDVDVALMSRPPVLIAANHLA